MLKSFLALTFAIPLCGQCQRYADSPFYGLTSEIPATARVEGWSHGSIKANGVVIDLFESHSSSSPDFDKIAGWSVGQKVDGNKPSQIFHFFIHYDHLDVVFAYDLLVEPVGDQDAIKCTFSALTDPKTNWPRNTDIAPVALPADLTPVVIRSGDAISITTLPLGQGRIAPVHYLRFTRMDRAPNSIQ